MTLGRVAVEVPTFALVLAFVGNTIGKQSTTATCAFVTKSKKVGAQIDTITNTHVINNCKRYHNQCGVGGMVLYTQRKKRAGTITSKTRQLDKKGAGSTMEKSAPSAVVKVTHGGAIFELQENVLSCVVCRQKKVSSTFDEIGKKR